MKGRGGLCVHSSLVRRSRLPKVVTEMRSFRLIGLLVAVAFPPLVASPAQAQGATDAACTMVHRTYLSPGFTMAKETGIYGTGVGITGAETGLITCVGQINGHWVTGPGTFGHKGKTWDGNCFGNQGAGTYSYTIPTAGGDQHATGTYTESRGINQEGPVEARQPGAVFHGRHQVLPTGVVTSWQNCMNSAVTEVAPVTVGVFRSI
jgi:hypothetical protein